MAEKSTRTIFRIATINVHSFNSPQTKRRNAEDLANLLKPFDFDLIALEEACEGPHLSKFQQHLSLQHVIFGRSYTSYDGNAVISRYPFSQHENYLSNHRARGGNRSILRFQLQSDDHSFVHNRNFAVTHLDHLNEDDRLAQMVTFAPLQMNTHILMGDMNAITREDYTDQYFKETVYGKRKQTGWELPRFDLTHLITKTYGFRDAFREMNSNAKDQDAATCPYGTRIDYIFFRPIADDHWLLRQCFIVDTLKYTDHKAVFATFEKQMVN